MRGRKPIPNSIKRARAAARGDRPDRLRDSGGRAIPDEPTPELGAPTPPDDLQGKAREAYFAFCGDLAGLEILAKTDRAALILLAQAWAQAQEAHAQLAKTGTVIKWPNGQPGPSPYLKVYQDAVKVTKGLLAEFGLTPTARSRIKLPEADDDAGDLVAALG